MQESSKKQIIVIVGIVAFALVVMAALLVLLLGSSKREKQDLPTDGKTTVYNDPVSGQQIIDQKNKSVEGETYSATTPQFAGFNKLLDQGMTLDQVRALYTAFEAYKPFASSKAQISLAISDMQSVHPQDADPAYRWSIKSHIVVNRKASYKVQIYYSGVSDVQLLLYNAAGDTLLFDSAAVD